MRIETLSLRQFRLYGQELFSFCPGLNYISGPNAVGKTTIIEAIDYLIRGKSFRAVTSAELIQKGKDSFTVEAGFNKNGVDQRLQVVGRRDEKKIIYNSTHCSSASALFGLIQGVIITPDDIDLIKGSPTERRRYLDFQLAQADPLYVHHAARYHRSMRQRNALLRSKKCHSIETWETEMAQSANYLVLQRRRLVQDLNPLVEQLYAQLSSEKSPLRLVYKCPAPAEGIKEYYQELYRKMREREILFGTTIHGPHKDDLLMSIADLDVRYYASEGQKRTVVIALKFGEWERLKLEADESPLLLLDDIGVCLDAERQKRLLRRLETFDQVFLTATNEGELPTSANRIRLN